ncbi:polysaccharide deacetylase family protein [Streptomyces sp. ISL-10]|uniref:polysaccharide deacetylase family protein n=1 Tax=Streptomyces sp. ISL-10 TaxID=2819172 RepID=UPI001BED25CB|nr:polysaccharide deacetylase family protein [Streptomyces sp. ISL-10]MBT2368525.1 polysaccharide deacetylase family protein [Streptomyces sp. ISL-10]
MTPIDRRSVLRAGAGAAACGTLAAGCADDAGPPTGPAADTPRPAPTPRRFPGRPAEITHGPRDGDRVALIFHDQGVPALTEAVLAEAERAGARLTVLEVGSWLDGNPRLARRSLGGGHDLGNHTQRHLSISEMTEQEAYAEITGCAEREITGCAERLRRLTGSIGTWFRPSRARRATPLVTSLVRRAGFSHVLCYDVGSLDVTSPGASAVTRHVTGRIRRGPEVSLHLGHADTVAAMPALLDELDRRGMRAVTTTELLS